MAFRAAEVRCEKGLHQPPRRPVADDEAAEADHIKVIIFNPLARGKRLVDQARANAGHLVGGDRGAHSAAANGYASIHLAARDSTCQRNDKIRIVIVRLRPEVSEIDHIMTGLAQHAGQMLLQFKTAMVSGNSDQMRFRLRCCAGTNHRSLRFRGAPVILWRSCLTRDRAIAKMLADCGQSRCVHPALQRSRFLADLPGKSLVQLFHQVIAILIEIKTRISERNPVPLVSFKSREATQLPLGF